MSLPLLPMTPSRTVGLSALLRLPLFALLFLLVTPPAEGQDVRELQRRVVALEGETAGRLAEATSLIRVQDRRIQSLERERAELLDEIRLLAQRLSAVEMATQAGQEATRREGEDPVPAVARETRGFERVGSAWRFEVGESFLELDETGVRISGPGELRLLAGSDVVLTAGRRATLSAAQELLASSGFRVELRGPGGQNRLLLDAAQASLLGSLVQLAEPSGKPVARMGDAVQVSPQSGTGQLLQGSPRVLVGGS
jgi:hypothetical protein